MHQSKASAISPKPPIIRSCISPDALTSFLSTNAAPSKSCRWLKTALLVCAPDHAGDVLYCPLINVHRRLNASAAALFFEESCFFNVSSRCSASAAGSKPHPIAPSDLMNLETSSAISPIHPHKCQKSGRLICPDSQRALYCLQAFMIASGDDLSTIKHLLTEKITGF